MDGKCESQIQDKGAEEEVLLKEIQWLKSELQSERASRAEERLRASEREEKLREERDRLKQMFISYDELFSQMLTPGSEMTEMLQRNAKELNKMPKKAKTCNASMQTSQLEKEMKQKALEKENLELRLLLKQEKSFSAQLQLEAAEMHKTLLYLQEETQKLLHAHEEVKGLLRSESEINNILQKETQHLKESLQRESAERLVEKARHMTGSQSSWDHEEKIKAWEYEKNILLKTIENLNLTVPQLLKSLDKNDAEMAALREENQELRRQNKLCEKMAGVIEEEVEEEVRVETAPEPPMVRRGRTDELPPIPIKRRKRPSRWRRFIHSFTCGTSNIEAVEEE